ncbi:hypothetical protein [Nodosilinea sp. P-1105]|uniref:hypothetical protein n=1 Tax=Nodosilinea sp. P-1105 TaxID=2546229 RepID=UPI00146E1AC4|nr:hypothetical protein [Nodosilinea sp. P-1105]NMF84156.1 hypothetical protein [Nodosilinea sp. P-1105]
MARFLTRRYVAVTSYEAQRLARLDGTPIHQIRHTPDVYLVHRTEWWAWWSDKCLTNAVSLPDSLCPEGLSPDAVELISEVWESASPPPQCGWSVLANVEAIVKRERLTIERLIMSPLQSESLEKLTVRFRGGDWDVLYCYFQFLQDSYLCEISQELTAFLD